MRDFWNLYAEAMVVCLGIGAGLMLWAWTWV